MTGFAARLAKNEGRLHIAGALQLLVFATVAAAALAMGGYWPTALGIGCFLAGLAHGASHDDGVMIARWTVPHLIAYVVAGCAVGMLMLAAPLAGLTVFLALSAWHFADTPDGGHVMSGAATGLIAIGGSALFQPDPTSAIFANLTGVVIPYEFMTALALAGGAGCLLTVGVAVMLLFHGTNHSGDALSPVLAFAGTLLLPPVLAVGAIFFLLHARPTMARQIERYGRQRVFAACSWPTALAMIGAIVLIGLTWTGFLSLPIAAAAALGMATPHMLIDQIAV